MGKRGPKRTPTTILDQRNRPTQQDRSSEPKPNAIAPVAPDWMEPEAKVAWEYLAPKMERLGILTEIDGNAFARYCQTWARWRQCEEFLRKAGGTTYTKKRYKWDKDQCRFTDELIETKIIEFPQVKQSQAYSSLLTKLESEFGLTPSGRASLSIGGGGETKDDPLLAMFRRRSMN